MSTNLPSLPTITLRPATVDDEPAIGRLAQLDSASVPPGVLLLAVLDGRPVAAIAIETGLVIADPFTRTVDLVEMLQARAERLRGTDSARPMAAALLGTRLRRARSTSAA